MGLIKRTVKINNFTVRVKGWPYRMARTFKEVEKLMFDAIVGTSCGEHGLTQDILLSDDTVADITENIRVSVPDPEKHGNNAMNHCYIRVNLSKFDSVDTKIIHHEFTMRLKMAYVGIDNESLVIANLDEKTFLECVRKSGGKKLRLPSVMSDGKTLYKLLTVESEEEIREKREAYKKLLKEKQHIIAESNEQDPVPTEVDVAAVEETSSVE